MSVGKKESYYWPDPLPVEELVTKGAKAVLQDIKGQRLGRGAAALRKCLARRFSVTGKLQSFKSTIDGEPITTQPNASATPAVLEREQLPHRFDVCLED